MLFTLLSVKMFKTILMFLGKFSLVCCVALQWSHYLTMIRVHASFVLLVKFYFKMFHANFHSLLFNLL